jgi:hypothetical protein
LVKNSNLWTKLQGGKDMIYLIRTPDFRIDSGGIRVMWGLYGWLLAKGQAAFINQLTNLPSVGIYPEIYHGNDMGTSKVIRYILQRPGMMGMGIPGTNNFKPGPTDFGDDEKYVFSKVYDEWNTPDDHILFLPIIDLHTFKLQDKVRDKTAFYVGKGFNLNEHPEGAVELRRGQDTQDQTKLANFLNECETLYVYDHLSAIMEIARLCGCRVVYLGDMPEEQLKLYEPGMNGLGYRKEVELNPDTFRRHYVSLGHTFSNKLDNLIERSQK